MMEAHKELKGSLVTLRRLHESCFPDYRAMFSPVVRRSLHVYDMRSEIKYLRSIINAKDHDAQWFYCIYDNQDNRLVGAIAIRNEKRYAGQLYSWLNENYWGNGFYQEALTLISDAYFAQPKVHCFSAHVDITNERSYDTLKKMGFADVGFWKGPWGRQYHLVLRKQ